MPNPYKFPKVYKAYGDSEPLCELAFELGLDWDRKSHVIEFPPLTLKIPRKDIHHIWSMGRRPDFKTNLIAMADWPHDRFHFGHRGEQGPLRMLCMLAKARKAERLDDPTEFCIEELNVAAGDKLVAGFVEYVDLTGWEWCEKYRQELLEMMS